MHKTVENLGRAKSSDKSGKEIFGTKLLRQDAESKSWWGSEKDFDLLKLE